MAYLSPGVYVEEVPSAIKPIAGVSTSVAAFVGAVPDNLVQVQRGAPAADGSPTVKWTSIKVAQPVEVPKFLTNWTQFTQAFGDLVGDPNNAAATALADQTKGAVDAGHRALAQAVYGFFNNGGSRCYVVRVIPPATGEPGIDNALKALAPIDEISLVAAPGMVALATRASLLSHCTLNAGRFAIVDAEDSDAATIKAAKMPANTDLMAVYTPWIKVYDAATRLVTPAGDGSLAVAPSGHIAGLYARVDDSRGVHKAPANEVLLGALGLTQAISRPVQDSVNSVGLNCIRRLNNNILVWGARTVGGDANADLKYINVRRTLLFLRKSIENGTQWVVFEPNTPALWQKINRNVSAFLNVVWRSGALFGDTPAQAYYVKCDLETNPANLRDLGQVVTEIGVAIARPAEFVVFRISQVAAS